MRISNFSTGDKSATTPESARKCWREPTSARCPSPAVLLFEDWDVEKGQSNNISRPSSSASQAILQQYSEQHPDNWDDDFENARNSPRKAIRTAPTLALRTRKRIIQSLLNPVELLSIDCRLLLQQPTFSQVYLKGHIRVFPDPFHNGHLTRPFFLFHHRSNSPNS